jgi:hypothetical protein
LNQIIFRQKPDGSRSTAHAMTASDLLFGKHVLLRKGKENYVLVTAK